MTHNTLLDIEEKARKATQESPQRIIALCEVVRKMEGALRTVDGRIVQKGEKAEMWEIIQSARKTAYEALAELAKFNEGA